MPRRFIQSHRWHLLTVESNKLQKGDLIFTKNRRRRKLQGHIAVAVSSQEIFHCSSLCNTARVEKVDDFFKNYEQRLTATQSVRYIDPRNKEMRKKNKGYFIRA